jgi:hypothetical protein
MRETNLPSNRSEVTCPEISMPVSFVKRFLLSRFNRSARRSRRSGIALGLEALEERWLPNATVITVTTSADDPITPIAGQTTLRDAIIQANQTTGVRIEFAPSLFGQTIQPTEALPAITGAGTTIDGSFSGITLDGSKVPFIILNPDPLPIVLDQIYAQPTFAIPSQIPDGLDVEVNNVTIEGLNIGNWTGSGIKVGSWNNSVASTDIIRNVIYKNSLDGVVVEVGSQATILNNSIDGNGQLGIALIGNANHSVPAPVLTNATYTIYSFGPLTSTCTIQGLLTLPNGAPTGVYSLEFFANIPDDNPPPNPQGNYSLGTVNVMASGGATVPFKVTLDFSPVLRGGFTATVTDPVGDTSEFSHALLPTQTYPPSPSPSPPTPPQSPPSSAPAAPMNPPPSFLQAATTLFIDGAELLFDQLEGFGNPNLAGVNAEIAFNMPYAGPFANWFVLAGEAAMAEQLFAAK